MSGFLNISVSWAYGALRALHKTLTTLVLFMSFSMHTAQAEEVTIAALGDSLTQGYGLAPTDGFVPQLERWLEDQGQDVKLINAGVSGDTSAGGLARIDWTLGDDVDALIVTLGGNDLLRGLDPAQTRSNLAGILEAASTAEVPVLLAGMEAPPNYGADYKTAFDALYPELAEEYGTLYYPVFLAPLGEGRDIQEIMSTLMQADGLHPNSDGVALIVEGIGPSVLELIREN